MDLGKFKDRLLNRMAPKLFTTFDKVPLYRDFKLIPGVTYQSHLPDEDPSKFVFMKDGEDSAVILTEDGTSTGRIRLFDSDVPVILVDHPAKINSTTKKI